MTYLFTHVHILFFCLLGFCIQIFEIGDLCSCDDLERSSQASSYLALLSGIGVIILLSRKHSGILQGVSNFVGTGFLYFGFGELAMFMLFWYLSSRLLIIC